MALKFSDSRRPLEVICSIGKARCCRPEVAKLLKTTSGVPSGGQHSGFGRQEPSISALGAGIVVSCHR